MLLAKKLGVIRINEQIDNAGGCGPRSALITDRSGYTFPRLWLRCAHTDSALPIRIIPELRAVHVERFLESDPVQILYFSTKPDLEGTVVPGSRPA